MLPFRDDTGYHLRTRGHKLWLRMVAAPDGGSFATISWRAFSAAAKEAPCSRHAAVAAARGRVSLPPAVGALGEALEYSSPLRCQVDLMAPRKLRRVFRWHSLVF